MKQLIEKYNLERIEFLKNNKSQITTEILEELRSFGLSGKQIALDILDISSEESLQKIHLIEIEKCREDILYFKNNYLLILNADELQDKMLKAISANKKVKLTSDRHTKKSYASIIYALHQFNFEVNKIIGVVSCTSTPAKEFISNTTNLYNCLPVWMKVQSRNLKTSMRGKNGSRIIIDIVDSKAFRGISLNALIIENAKTVKQNKLEEFFNAYIPYLNAIDSKIIMIEENLAISTDFYEVNENTILEEAVKVQKPILRRNLKQIVKDFIQSLYKRIIG
jgi:hypothetical protein